MINLEDLMSGGAPIPDEGSGDIAWEDGLQLMSERELQQLKIEIWSRFDWGRNGESLDKDDVARALSTEASLATEATGHSGRELFLMAVLVGAELQRSFPRTAEFLRQWADEDNKSHIPNANVKFVKMSAARLAAGERNNNRTFRQTTGQEGSDA